MEGNNNQNRRPNSNNINRTNNNNQRKPKKVKNPDPMGNPVAMGRYAIKIIKDIAFGKCSAESVFDNFRNPILVQNAINEVMEKIAIENVYLVSLGAYCSRYDDPRARHLLKTHNNGYYAWNLVYRVLCQIAQTGDPSPLLVLVNQLPQYKYSM